MFQAIFKLGNQPWKCEEALQSFRTLKEACVENSFCLEARNKRRGAAELLRYKFMVLKCQSNCIQKVPTLIFQETSNKNMSLKSNLKELLVGFIEKNCFQCFICKKLYKRKPNLEVHMKIHTDNKDHKCTVCMCMLTRKLVAEECLVL